MFRFFVGCEVRKWLVCIFWWRRFQDQEIICMLLWGHFANDWSFILILHLDQVGLALWSPFLFLLFLHFNFLNLLYFLLLFLNWFVIIEEVYQFNLIDIWFCFRIKNLFRCIGVSHWLFLWLIALLSDFFFLELFLNYAEKIIELIMFFLNYCPINWKKVFVQILMSELHYVLATFFDSWFVFLRFSLFETEVLKYFVFWIFLFCESCWGSFISLFFYCLKVFFCIFWRFFFFYRYLTW